MKAASNSIAVRVRVQVPLVALGTGLLWFGWFAPFYSGELSHHVSLDSIRPNFTNTIFRVHMDVCMQV